MFAGLFVHRNHPNPSSPPIELELLDETWQIGESMSVDVDESYTAPDGTVTRYRASLIKNTANYTTKAFGSDGGLFGTFVLRDAPNVLIDTSNDIFDYSDPQIVNALAEALYDENGDLVHAEGAAYKKKHTLLRNWIFQESRTVTPGTPPGSWILIEIQAVWSVGDWNLLNTYDVKSGQYPHPQVYGQRDRFCASAVHFGPNMDYEWLAQASYHDYEFNYFNVFFRSDAFTAQTFPGPKQIVSNPTNGQVVSIDGKLTLNQDGYDCGTVTWTTTWRFVA